MSRCFPYPPPGFAGKSASNDALILTIKLQRESEKVKLEKKKDRKREKKEKKREDKANGTLNGEKKILAAGDEKLYQAGKHAGDEKQYQAGKQAKCPADFAQNKQQASSYELMEKSSLTEEHGRPCSSSDSTENSGKRKRQSPPQAVNHARTSGTVFRIVLDSRKKDGAQTTSSKNVAPSLTTARVNSLSEKAGAVVKSSTSILPVPPVMSNATQQPIVTPSNKEKLPSSVKAIDEGSTSKEEKKGSTSKEEKKLPRPLRKYKALFENWVQPAMEVDTVDDDEDWLFSSKSEKRVKCCKEEVPNCVVEPPSFQPRACFLGDADIYALPFVVPF